MKTVLPATTAPGPSPSLRNISRASPSVQAMAFGTLSEKRHALNIFRENCKWKGHVGRPTQTGQLNHAKSQLNKRKRRERERERETETRTVMKTKTLVEMEMETEIEKGDREENEKGGRWSLKGGGG